MNFPVVIHKDKNSDFGVTVPDLPGCFSAGRTIDEALAMAKEAIELHLEGLLELGEAVPQPATVQKHQGKREYRDGVWAMVSVDEGLLPLKVVRLNITMPQRVLDAVDRYAKANGETRSGLLSRAATNYIGRRADKALRPAGRGRPGGIKSKGK